MADITISGKVAELLQRLAEDAHRSVEEVLQDALDTYSERTNQGISSDAPPLGSLARMAWVAARNPIVVEATDITEHSRDILRNEYAEHLMKRGLTSDDTTNE